MSKKSDKPKDGTVKTGVGYVSFKEIMPIWREAKSAGGILLTQNEATGAAGNTQATWGRVVSCGQMGNRTTCEPFAEETQRRTGFPLDEGTWIVFRKANAWTIFGDVKCLQTCDVVATFPPTFEWKDVLNEVDRLSDMFKDTQ